MGIKRRLASGIICLTLALAGVLPVRATAASTTDTIPTTGCNKLSPISAGLWQGVNIALGTNYYGCTGNIGSTNNGTNGSTVPPATPTPQSGEYVALGDSIAAGLGLPAAANTDPACGVSTQAYPAVVASALSMPYRNIACSGATAGDLFTEQHLSGTSRDIAPQLSTAFANGTPSLITVTAGANDTYWQYFIRKCYVSTCGTNTDRTLAAGLLAALQLKFAYALNNISLRSNGQPPRVVLTGYYEPFSAACAQQQTNVTAQELAWLNSQTQAINGVIANAASQHSSFVRYAPVSFSGHELCSANPWVQGLNDAAPFHPTAQGQRVIAQAVTQQAQ